MKNFLFIAALSVALLAACGPTPTPVPTVNVAATMSIISGTMVAGTLTAQTTATPILATFSIENLTDQKKLIVTITGMTNQGDPRPVYKAYEVSGAFTFDIPLGDYQYQVQIGDTKQIIGSFIIRNPNRTTMKVYKNKVVIDP